MAASGVTPAQANRKIRQEATREMLATKGLIQKVLDDVEKVSDLARDIPKDHLERIKFATDTRLDLIKKYLPDLKAVEIGFDPDEPLEVNHNHTVNLNDVKGKVDAILAGDRKSS